MDSFTIPCYKHTTKLNKCITDNSFHLDGTLTDSNNNTIINLEQSAIIIPFITTVKKNGGGTAVIPGSHKLINDYVLRSNYKTNLDLEDTIDKIVKKNKSNIIDVCWNPGRYFNFASSSSTRFITCKYTGQNANYI